jgi:adenosylcobinamide amidohydrolase
VTAAGVTADGVTADGVTAAAPAVRLCERVEDGIARPVLVWDAGPGWRMISSGVVGGGIGERSWWLNAGVRRDYARTDPATHIGEIAAAVGLRAADGPGRDCGVGMLTAADVRTWTRAQDGGVHAVATVGLGVPVPAAAPPDRIAAETTALVGTINVLVVVPVPLTDAALVNAVLTATEAKTQALVEHAVPGTGTSSDAICIACPAPVAGEGAGEGAGAGTGDPEPFGGPRSPWGARLARAVHRAVGDGTASWLDRHPVGNPHRRWPVGPAD